MVIEKTHFEGIFVIKPRVFSDARGYFFESFNRKSFFENTGKDINFVQDNESKSTYGVIRGLHYQLPPYGQSKLVRVIYGKVLDIAVDLRPASPTFGQYFSKVLDDITREQVFIPEGFAHGYSVLSETAVFAYKCDQFYSREHETGILFNDTHLNIDWMIPSDQVQISEKDLLQKNFAAHDPYK